MIPTHPRRDRPVRTKKFSFVIYTSSGVKNNRENKMGFLSFLFIEGFLIALFFAIVIEATIALAEVNKNKGDESDADRELYDKARYNLGWCIGIGWTLVALSIIGFIIFIVVQFFGGAEVEGAAGLAEGGLMAAEGAEGAALAAEEAATVEAEKDGLFGLNKMVSHGGFTGFIENAILFTTLAGLFAFGVLCAIAATAIGQTSTKKGYSNAIWATVLGIIPFSLIIIWYIANMIYVHRKKERLKEIEKEKAERKRLIAKKKGIVKGELIKKQGAVVESGTHVSQTTHTAKETHPTPTKTTTKKTKKTSHSAPAKTTHSTKTSSTSGSSGISSAATSMYNSLSQEQKDSLMNTAKSAIKNITG